MTSETGISWHQQLLLDPNKIISTAVSHTVQALRWHWVKPGEMCIGFLIE